MNVVVVGGGPAGAVAAERLAAAGLQTLLVDRDTTRPKACGGALSSPVIEEFGLPASVVERTVHKVRLVPPSGRFLDISLDGRPVSLVCREKLDSYLRQRAIEAGARVLKGVCKGITRHGSGRAVEVHVADECGPSSLWAEVVIAADGALSAVAKSMGLSRERGLVAYQERVETGSADSSVFDRIQMYFHSEVSPDFYGWVFPKSDHLCVGTVTWSGRRRLQGLVQWLKEVAGLTRARVIKREGGVLPRGVRSRVVVGRVLIVGDAGGFVSPISGEGIYYAMKSGQLAASAVLHAAASGRVPEDLAEYEATWPKMFRRLTQGLGLAQRVYYSCDHKREAFTSLLGNATFQRARFFPYLDKDIWLFGGWQDIRAILINLCTLFCA